MKKFLVTYELNGNKMERTIEAPSREAAELQFELYSNVSVRTLAGVLDERIRGHISKLKFGERVERDPEYKGQVKERLRACADAAYMFGEDSQESLERTLGRMVDCNWEITGLDGHMFSFGFSSPAGFWGGIIFHCSAKEWSAHTWKTNQGNSFSLPHESI